MRYGENAKTMPASIAAARVPGQRPHQQGDADARQREAGQKHQVVDQQRRRRPTQCSGADDDARHEQRLGERERLPLGIEDVRVEQTRRRARQLVRHPRQRPRLDQRIAVVVHTVVQVQHLRIGHHGGQDREQDQRRREETPGVQSFSPDILPSCRMSSSSVSASTVPGRVDDRAPLLQRRRGPVFVFQPHAAVGVDLDHAPRPSARRTAS